MALAATLVVLAALTSWPAGALAEETGGAECASISARGIERQMNLLASETLVKCGVVPGGSATGSSAPPPTTVEPAFPGSDVDVITGTETYPHVTQSESSVWSHGSTVVVNYNDSRGATETPQNLSGVSVSTNSGATFSRLGSKSPLTGHVRNDGDPILVYNAKLGKWFAGDLVAGEGTGSCGVKGIGLWTSTNAETWTVGACAHTGSNDDRESMWVDNNAASPFYGRMYVSLNNFAVGGGDLEVTHSDDGTTWSTPVALTSSFRRNVQLTGSPSSDGTVFVAGQEENGGGVGNTGQQNYMYRSTNGGVTWTSTTMGPKFTIAGSTACGYFPAIPPIWRETGWGQPAVGPNGVVMYDYAAHGEGSDESDIFFVRSTNNGETWGAPVRLNTDSSGKAQWMPSLRVSPTGVVEATWYDRRNTTNGENYQRFARVSTNNGASWGPDEPLSTVLIPQPTQPDPNIQACYAGDYNYTTANSTTGLDTWTDGRVSIEGKPVQKVFFHSLALVSAPSATTEAASGITKSGATLNGTVNPEGAETHYHFEYDTKEYKPKEPPHGTKTTEVNAGSGTSNVKASAPITGLTPSTRYHFRIVASNSAGMTEGADQPFTTPNVPSVTTGAASSVTEAGATLNGTVNPNGSETKFYFEYGTTTSYGSKTAEVSAGAGTSALEESARITGLLPTTAYHFRIVATSTEGTSKGTDQIFTTHEPAWALQTTRNPTGAEVSRLRGVSCTSYNACIAVGLYGGAFAPLAERWNGTEWALQTVPSPLTTFSEFQDVSCSSSTACTAVGSEGYPRVPLAERWNGTEWSIQSVPSPKAEFSNLWSVSCASATACTAVGTAGYPETMFAEHWNGVEWTMQSTPNPTGAKQTRLYSVSCSSATACTAVGAYENSSGFFGTLVERWNGTEWSQQEIPSPTGAKQDYLIGVSCSSATACTGAGVYRNSSNTQVTLAESWNGAEWKVQTTPNPTGASESTLYGVSCTSSTACTAVGYDYQTSPTGAYVTLGENWNGTEWKVQTTPNPTGTTSSWLEGISCMSPSECVAVGRYVGKSGEPSIGEIYH